MTENNRDDYKMSLKENGGYKRLKKEQIIRHLHHDELGAIDRVSSLIELKLKLKIHNLSFI